MLLKGRVQDSVGVSDFYRFGGGVIQDFRGQNGKGFGVLILFAYVPSRRFDFQIESE